ncbi:MAG: Rpn family recombination-promoting nuclease/putative transposase [Clostridium sp.]|nr:Rpn family recombination-promoting nuclease/putative transposase [Clostridium sp.]
MSRETKVIKLKLDIIFKRVFGNEKNDKIIAAFVEDLLELERGSIQKIEINNVELPPDELDKKFSRLDLKMHIDDKVVNIEMQVNYESDFKDRTLFYWSKLYSEELSSGEEYDDLKKTICINIINFNAFECNDYHSHFKVKEIERNEVLSDKLDIHFFELKKIKKSAKHKPMEDWLNLINAETEGELMDIESTTQIKEIRDTIVILREMNADEKLKQEVYYREKRLHDEASALGHARREGIAEGLEKGRVEGEAKGLIKGRAEGEAKGLAKGEAKREAEIVRNLRKMGMTEEQIKAALGND